LQQEERAQLASRVQAEQLADAGRQQNSDKTVVESLQKAAEAHKKMVGSFDTVKKNQNYKLGTPKKGTAARASLRGEAGAGAELGCVQASVCGRIEPGIDCTVLSTGQRTELGADGSPGQTQ